jgi:hypothetical protein
VRHGFGAGAEPPPPNSGDLPPCACPGLAGYALQPLDRPGLHQSAHRDRRQQTGGPSDARSTGTDLPRMRELHRSTSTSVEKIANQMRGEEVDPHDYEGKRADRCLAVDCGGPHSE